VSEAEVPRVILVDDEPYILEALRRQLGKEPFALQAFQDPLKALESLFQDGECAIIVSDNQMPGLQGLELLAKAREFAPRARRVLLTGHTDLNQAINAFNDGTINRFVNKPWDTDDLIAVLREELGHFRSDPRAGAGDADQATSARLQATVRELKQALTQVALYEDGNHTRRLRVTPMLRRLAIVVVDGNPDVRRLLVNTLQKAGIMNVQALAGSEEALAHLRQVPAVDVVLSEWSLPGLDGMALFQALRAGQTPSAKAIFFLMTTRENRKAVEFALGAGVDYYLIKPFHLDTLLEQVERRLRPVRKDAQEARLAPLRGLSFVVSNADQDSRYKIQQSLLINGIQKVTLADSGAKALRVVQERKVDVLILDCNLLDVLWGDLRERLAELSGERRPPALIVTSVAPMLREVAAMDEAGITAFVPGPIRPRDLFDAILKALEDDGRTEPAVAAEG
jgi:DNA-binding NtrC family response regulator